MGVPFLHVPPEVGVVCKPVCLRNSISKTLRHLPLITPHLGGKAMVGFSHPCSVEVISTVEIVLCLAACTVKDKYHTGSSVLHVKFLQFSCSVNLLFLVLGFKKPLYYLAMSHGLSSVFAICD